jgi:lipopolysaccharide transport protein LptA
MGALDYIMSGYRPPGNSLRAIWCLLALFVGVQAGHADILDFSSDDTVTITAQKAWEADEADVIHFSGQFILRAPDWYSSADTAVVYGKLDNPDKLILEGKPAKIFFLRETGEDAEEPDPAESVEGEASTIEYFRATNKLVMRGAATLKRKDNMLTSEVIEYDVDSDRYSASGEGGINILFNPED